LALGAAEARCGHCKTPNEQASHQQAGGAGDIKQHETFWERLTTDRVAVGTFILCFVTGVLAYVTYGLYRATTNLARDTRVASDAALLASTEATKLAAKEFLSTHRPKIRVRKVFA
jgi:hypothetical protein